MKELAILISLPFFISGMGKVYTHTQKIVIVSFQFRKYGLEFKYTDQDGILKLWIFYIIFLFISQNVSMNVLRVKAF